MERNRKTSKEMKRKRTQSSNHGSIHQVNPISKVKKNIETARKRAKKNEKKFDEVRDLL